MKRTKNQSENARWNRNVLRCRLKDAVLDCCSDGGRLLPFQAAGARRTNWRVRRILVASEAVHTDPTTAAGPKSRT